MRPVIIFIDEAWRLMTSDDAQLVTLDNRTPQVGEPMSEDLAIPTHPTIGDEPPHH